MKAVIAVLKILVLVIILAIIGIGVAVPFGYRAFVAATGARQSVQKAQYALATNRDFKETASRLEEAKGQFENASHNLKNISYLRAVPWVSRNFKATQMLLSAAVRSSGALAEASRAAEDIYGPLRSSGQIEIGKLTPGQRQELLENIAKSVPVLRDAESELSAALKIIRSVPNATLLEKLQSEIAAFERQSSIAVGVLSDGLPILEVIPSLLGYPTPSSYLFLLQNSDEMRPTGGFIGTYGIITFESGHITKFFTDDVYNLDRLVPPSRRPLAPQPIRDYLEQPRFYLRDANFDPDFPTSARQVLTFYKEEMAYAKPQKTDTKVTELDGVIAVAPQAIRPLLTLTGPITVGAQTFNADNLTDALEYEVEIGFAGKGTPRTQRKAIVSELGHALIAKVMSLPVSKWPEVLHIVRTYLDEKQILIFVNDSGLQERMSAFGWTGEIRSAPGDYLAVFDANMFSLKTDPYVTRSIFYNVRREGGLVGEVEIVYSYPKEGPAWKTKGYRTWTRVYVPKGSILTRASGAMKEEGSIEPGAITISQETDKTVFGAFLAVQVGEVKRLKFVYRLPEYITQMVQDGTYELTVQKQSGTLGHSLTISSDFGKVAKLWSPTGFGVIREEDRLTWQTNLKRDQLLHIEF